jgi:hypothetical protein
MGILGMQSNLTAQCYVFWGDTTGNNRCFDPNIGVYSYDGYERIFIGKQRIERRLFKNTKVVSEEYIGINKDTFLYIRYDSLTHESTERGHVVFSKPYGVDTIISFDPKTLEEQISYQFYYSPSRIGEWIFETESKFHAGKYLNDKRIGKWLEYNRIADEGFYLYYDEEGNFLSKEPENIILTKNVDKIIGKFNGEWYAGALDDGKKVFWRLEPRDSFDRAYCMKITKDSIIYNDTKTIGCYGLELFRKAASWKILPDGELVLSDRLFELVYEKKKRFAIKSLTDYIMEVVRLD